MNKIFLTVAFVASLVTASPIQADNVLEARSSISFQMSNYNAYPCDSATVRELGSMFFFDLLKGLLTTKSRYYSWPVPQYQLRRMGSRSVSNRFSSSFDICLRCSWKRLIAWIIGIIPTSTRTASWSFGILLIVPGKPPRGSCQVVLKVTNVSRVPDKAVRINSVLEARVLLPIVLLMLWMVVLGLLCKRSVVTLFEIVWGMWWAIARDGCRYLLGYFWDPELVMIISSWWVCRVDFTSWTSCVHDLTRSQSEYHYKSHSFLGILFLVFCSNQLIKPGGWSLNWFLKVLQVTSKPMTDAHFPS